MNIEYMRDTALSLPHVTERCPYGPDYLAFEIGGKQFCLVDLNSKWDFYNIKIDPVYGEELRERYEAVSPGYHMNKRHWISVKYTGDMPEHMHRELLTHAYYQTLKGLPKKVREQLTL
ncbi:MmcQ/YjbR family DNA-binding protein [Duncaniella freteri]|jgi:predicted DNA-binding protein (MmcQ/YjbR family)|uniref:MmcQ/YjbR family DNA-binding protein n=1 Tax=Duncaniella freteri TaxID=2530391 RepID=UPI0013719FAF|nr:MmcQ/YjbR family DNA-binding protein [Duncaniella freteri]NBJ08334.1 MmcQ/YjbR family DNA-binding protein [Alistipes sp. Z76]NCE70329.1 MmcQ/YjbR family DNA-binding protein [Muribaculaceae bacterium M3]